MSVESKKKTVVLVSALLRFEIERKVKKEIGLFLVSGHSIEHCSKGGEGTKGRTWGQFLERPGKLTGPVSYFEIEVSRKVGCVLTSNEVHFVSLAENFTV